MTFYHHPINNHQILGLPQSKMQNFSCSMTDVKLLEALQESIDFLDKVYDYKDIVNIVIEGEIQTAITGKTSALENLMDTLEDMRGELTCNDLIGYKFGNFKDAYEELNEGILNNTVLNFFNDDVISITTQKSLNFHDSDDVSLLEVNAYLTRVKHLLQESLNTVQQEMHKNYSRHY